MRLLKDVLKRKNKPGVCEEEKNGFARACMEWGGREVDAMTVYKDMFWLGDNLIQRSGEKNNLKANPLAYYKNNNEKKGHYRVLLEDTFEETLKELQEADFAILNGLTYFGRKNTQDRANMMYGMIFDVDDATETSLGDFLSGSTQVDAYPLPNYIVLSGHGIHLYYIFERPIPLYPYTKFQLKELKYALTTTLWNALSENETKQFQGINQGFRVIGGKTKIDGVRVRAFQLNTHPTNLDKLCSYVDKKYKVDEDKLFKESRMTLAEAQKRYPEWYEKVIVNDDHVRKYWKTKDKCNGDNPYALYDWWKDKMVKGVKYHKRYFNVMCLAIYGVKTGVEYEKVYQDAIDLVPFLNSVERSDPFTEEDVKSAMECYDERYHTFPIKDIVKISGIDVPTNKRNFRKQAQHVKIMNAIREIEYPEGEWRNANGRPKGSKNKINTKQEVVVQWRKDNPAGKKMECHKDTGLSRVTIDKYWDGGTADED